jgi:bacteriocin biosynthesis cyclodehydratase domain-containing protein
VTKDGGNMMPREASFRPVHLICVGPFAEAVNQEFETMRNDIIGTEVVDDTFPLPSTWPASRVNVLVSWRPVPSLCELLNQVSYDLHCPFVPVIQDLTAIRLGPIVVPGQGPCWHCWITRWRQHSGWTKERTSLLQYYAAHPEAGPQGYLEPFVTMAAVRIAQTITNIDSDDALPGSVWQVDMMTRQIATATVVGVHDCSWCGLGKPRLTRSVAGLQQELSYLNVGH